MPLYRYATTTRHIPLIVITVWMFIGVALFLWVLLRSDVSLPIEKQLGFAVPWILLIALGIWGQSSYNKRLKPIEVSDSGLWIGDRGRPGSILISWEGIERVQRIHDPRGGRGFVPGRGGIFVWHDGQTFVIHEQLRGFEECWFEVEKQLRTRGIREDQPGLFINLR